MTELSGLVSGVVGGVTDQSLLRVDPGGWPHPGDAVAHHDLPDPGVHGGVVVPALQAFVVQVGPATQRPRDHVVDLAPFGRQVAAGDHTATVPGDQGLALRGGRQPDQPAQVQGRPLGLLWSQDSDVCLEFERWR